MRQRPSSQFPSKYSQLPDINGPSSSNPTNQLIPYAGNAGASPFQSTSNEMETHGSNERFRSMEARLNISEKSCRALLEEMVRLQNDLKSSVRRSEEVIHEQALSRQQIDALVRKNIDSLMHLSSRIQRLEQKIQQDEIALNMLKNQAQNLEQIAKGSQQDLFGKKDMHMTKIQELQMELESVIQEKKQLEMLMTELSGNLRQVTSRIDSQHSKLSNTISEVIMTTKRLENEQRVAQDALKKSLQNRTDPASTYLRDQIESRINDLQETIQTARQNQEQEVQQRISSEQNVFRRLAEVEASVNNQTRKQDETLHSISLLQKDREHNKDYNIQRLQNQLQDSIEEISQRLHQKEMAIRDELQEKFLQLERLCQQERTHRTELERSLKGDTERIAQSHKQRYTTELQNLVDTVKADKSKTKETLQKLNEGIQLLEQTFDNNKKRLEKIVSAEIHSRKTHEKATTDKFYEVQEKIQIATIHIQQNLGEVKGRLEDYMNKIQKEVLDIIQEKTDATTRALADLDARLNLEKERIQNVEESIEEQIANVLKNIPNPEDLKQKVEINEHQISQISQTQEDYTKELRGYKRQIENFPNEIYSLDERLKLLKAEIESRVSTEAQIRLENIEKIQQQLASMPKQSAQQPIVPYATEKDIENCQNSIKRLAESVQTVKTVLGMKIQSEQKLRVSEVKSLQNELIRIRAMIEPIVGKRPRIFVKAWIDEKLPLTADINKWTIYTAYRWLSWKKEWLRPVQRKRLRSR
ncbi:coiled-coil domain-containing protein 154-like isoform X3 [Octopus sinensis]|uniref:Coiled-coil domain-containing protein 154-like isoform X3 n=1 Tax=Octopus sinensis TaxID=2607531 RepID=A0A7E6EXY3_9MOLL|nr:coiled-coil domain-containing protein 154-like isoform X3 [Octopus sinensis]